MFVWWLVINYLTAATVRFPAILLDVIFPIRLDEDKDHVLAINRSPEPDETDIPREGPVRLQIASLGNADVDIENTLVYINSVLAFDGSSFSVDRNLCFQSGWNRDGWSWVGAADEIGIQSSDPDMLYEIAIYPDEDFESEEEISVRVVSQTVHSSATMDETYSFTIEDYSAPEILLLTPVDEFTLDVEFNEPVRMEGDGDLSDALTLGNYSIERQNEDPFPAVHLEVVAVEAVDDSTVRLTFQWESTPVQIYELTVENVEDIKGNAIDPDNNTATWSGYEWPVPEGREFSIYYNMLPGIARQLDENLDLRRLTACFEEILYLLLWWIDKFTWQVDIDRATESQLDELLLDMGNPFNFEMDVNQKRKLLRVLWEIYQSKGIDRAMENVIYLFLGLEVRVRAFVDFLDEEGQNYMWRLGHSRLGTDTALWPTSEWSQLAFNVYSDVILTDDQRGKIEQIIEIMRPAESHFAFLIEPDTIPETDHWQLGRSRLGVETFLHE